MPLMLPPAPKKRAAEASATNAMSSVYSMRSWPCSSFQKLRKNVIVVISFDWLRLRFHLRDHRITRLGFRDLAITALSAARHGCGNCRPLAPVGGAENQRHTVVVNDAPVAGFL